MNVLGKKKIIIETNDFKICLDNNDKSCDFSFLSHAHSDHLFKSKKPVISSDATIELAKIRGYNFERLNNVPENISLIDNGHMLGSKALIINEDKESLVFTSDFSTRNRGFINGFKPIKCNKLIIESTFGNPFFLFPDYSSEMKRAKDFVEDNLKKDYLTVFMGYPLGKIQEIQHYFNDSNSSVHEKILPYNNAYENFGINLGTKKNIEDANILFSPLMRTNNNFFNKIKQVRGVKFGVFSGWNLNPSYKNRFLADEGFTISDHADFKDLLKVVHKSKASEIFVHHGSSKEFVEFLKMEGFNATNLD